MDQGLIERPVRYGQSFQKPSRKTLRKARAANGKRIFDAVELRKIIDAAGQPLRAMVLLGINGGLGSTDVAELPISGVDLETRWLDYPRVKTAVERKCPLWLETVEALREVIHSGRQPKDQAHADLLFLTKYGQRWVKTNKSGTPADAIAQEFGKLLTSLGLKRSRLGFYAIRHTFQTIGEEAGETATKAIMGHVDDSISARYREWISDERLVAVTEHGQAGLFKDDDEK